MERLIRPSDRALDSIVHSARKAGCTVEVVRDRSGPRRGRRHLATRLRITGRLYAIHALENRQVQRGRNVVYARSLVADVPGADGHVFCVLTKHGFAKLIVPSKSIKRFLEGRRTRSACIEVSGIPGRVFDFWQYRNRWPQAA